MFQNVDKDCVVPRPPPECHVLFECPPKEKKQCAKTLNKRFLFKYYSTAFCNKSDAAVALLFLLISCSTVNFDILRMLLQGGYSQNFLRQILKIFVILTWILEPIKH
jgi:hypothetical protein